MVAPLNSPENPPVTIGIVVKNGASTIHDTMKSIINQDFPRENMELIFVDDGSNDNTLSIIKEYSLNMGMRAKIFHHTWKGLGYSRNVVVKNAVGEYIIWIDADMILSNDYIKKLVEYMENNAKVGIAKGKFKLNPEANWVSTLEKYSRAAGRMVDFNNRKKSSPRALGTGGAIYRVKMIRDVGGFDMKITGHGEDLDAELRVLADGWMLSTVDTWFLDRERFAMTWRDIWENYYKRGYNLHYLSSKYKDLISLFRMSPFAAFFSGLFDSFKLYKLLHQKIVFLMPIQNLYKMTAWCLGFMQAKYDTVHVIS